MLVISSLYSGVKMASFLFAFVIAATLFGHQVCVGVVLEGRKNIYFKQAMKPIPYGRTVNVSYVRCHVSRPTSIQVQLINLESHFDAYATRLHSVYDWGFAFVVERLDYYKLGYGMTRLQVEWEAEFDAENFLSTPCRHNESCVNTELGQQCQCDERYDGKFCEIDIVHCLSNPCANNGTCNEQANGFTCSCIDQFTGVTCTTKIPQCPSSPCQNRGVCFETDVSYGCECRSGFGGKSCELYTYSGSSTFAYKRRSPKIVAEQVIFPDCLKQDPSDYDVKLIDNNQTEHPIRAVFPVRKYGFFIHALLSDPGLWVIQYKLSFKSSDFRDHQCENDGRCINAESSQTCECQDGFHGKYCENMIIPCRDGLCENGGTCRDTKKTGFRCKCRRGFSGDTCSLKNVKGSIFVGKNTLFCTDRRQYEVVYDECHTQNASKIWARVRERLTPWRTKAKVNILRIFKWGFSFEVVKVNERGTWNNPEAYMKWKAFFDAATFNDKVCFNGGFCHNTRRGHQCHCLDGFTGEFCETRAEGVQ